MLEHISPDDRELLQKYAGQCLLGRNIMQRFLILDGVGGASKGSFVLIIDEIIGQKNVYELRTRMLQERFEIGRMLGRTLLVGSDVRGDFLSHPGAHRIKSLVGGDPLEGEMKGSNQRFTIYGVFNLMITSNTRLHIRLEGDRSAWERRLSIVRYDQAIYRQADCRGRQIPRLKGSNRNSQLVYRRTPKTAQDYHATGDILMSQEQRDRVDTLLSESDSLRLFVRDKSFGRKRSRTATKDSLTTEEIISEYIDDCVTDQALGADSDRVRGKAVAEFDGRVLRTHQVARSSTRPKDQTRLLERSVRDLKKALKFLRKPKTDLKEASATSVSVQNSLESF